MATKKQKLVIIDCNALIHRAWHALPPLADKNGKLTNAVYGFTMIFIKALKDLKPEYLAATFDLKGKTFRHEQYQEYKATRVKQPDEFYDQIPVVKEVLRAFNVPIYEKQGFEADDVIGTIANLKTVDRPDIDTIIVTGDQDCLQLVDYNTRVLSPHKGFSETILYGEAEVKEKFGGLAPKQLIDYKGLRGDTSDNIPGVKGIGEKGAIDLLTNFHTLDGIYKNIKSEKIKDRTRELLIEQKDQAYMSKKLATIVTDVPLDFKLEKTRFHGYNQNAVIDIFQRLNFKSLMRQLSTLSQAGIEVTTGQGGLFDKKSEEKNSAPLSSRAKRGISSKKDDKKETKPINERVGKQDYQLINDKKSLKGFLADLKKQAEFCFDTETTSLNPFEAQLLGISFCWNVGEAYYVTEPMIKIVEDDLAKIFENKKIKKIGHNLKYDIEIVSQYFFSDALKTRHTLSLQQVENIYFDTMVASYLLNPGSRQHSLDTIAFVELGYQMQSIEELIGTGKAQINMSDVPVEKVSWYSCEDADICFRLYQKFAPELEQQNIFGLFENLEMPLVQVLADVERNGVKIDSKFLTNLSKELSKKIITLEKNIYKLANTEFNVASPKQLKEVLFEKMKISSEGLGKTKTGISTGASELEKLKGEHEIIDLILEFRELSKLKNTYLDALPLLVDKDDGRVHTSFNQTVTATGRLSSSEPNLQNIPIRSELGAQIRTAFIAEPGYKLVKADYSQIELRIVASLSDDTNMIGIFKSGGDIHTQTAAIINNIKPEEVTKEMRRKAKEVNFGVLYGMGAWGLASRTGISNHEAQDFINKYFTAFKKVKKYLDETVEIARDKGYVETLLGRRRYLPEINSSMNQVRSGAERMALNHPIQGTAADLIKLAMIEINKKLAEVSPKSRMILQVHDELVFEVPDKELKKVAEFIKEKMCSVLKLKAPIEVEVSAGDNWGETEKIKL